MRREALLLLSIFFFAAFSAAGQIVVSDGPSSSADTNSASGSGKIVTTDGPREWTQATKQGVHLYGQWVVESEGPGTARIVGAPSDPSASPFPSPVFPKASVSAPRTSNAKPTGAIVISDGPGNSSALTPTSKIVIIDGPEPLARPAKRVAVKHLPKVAHAKKKAPVVDAETSTLAPLIPPQPQSSPQSLVTPAATPWKALALTLSLLVAILSASLVWLLRKRAF